MPPPPPQRPPEAIRYLLQATRAVLNAIGDLVRDPELVEALNAELGIAHRPDPETVQQRIAAMNGELDAIEADPSRTGLDDQALDLLIGGQRFYTLMQLVIGENGPAGQRFADFAYSAVTIIAGEKLRHDAPLAYAVLRLLMLGYESVEAVPALDPFKIYDRLTGRATRVAASGFDAGGWVAMIGLQAAVIGASVPFGRIESKPPGARKPGEIYFEGEMDFKIGWEPDPTTAPEVQALLARTLTFDLDGVLKVEGKHGSVGNENELTLGYTVTMVVLEAADGGPGVLFRVGPEASGTLDLVVNEFDTRKKLLKAETSGVNGVEFLWAWQPDGWDAERDGEFDTFRFLGASGGVPGAKLSFAVEGGEGHPALRLFGKPDTSRFDIVAIESGIGIDGADAYGFLDIRDGRLVLELKDLPLLSFLEDLGGTEVEAKLDGRLKLDGRKGLSFAGEAGLRARLLSDAGGKPVRVDYVDVELGHAEEGGLKLGFLTAGRFALGPFAASLDRFGLDFVFSRERRGRAELVPPLGIGIRLDLGFMRGGGYLGLDFEKREFAGAFEFTLFGFSLKAIVILNTEVERAPFALLAMVYARWPGGIELFARFTLNAIGGMIGVNRGFSGDKLVEGLTKGSMDAILFPDDPVGDAPRILAALREICPLQPGALTLGFMAELGWGVGELCALRIGVILPLEPDGLNHLYVLGQLRLVCFTKTPKPIRIEIVCDSVIEIGFDPFSVRMIGSLRDSRIGPLTIEGQAVFALRTGADSRFLIAAGGFHPDFKQIPPDIPKDLKRLGIAYRVGVIKISGNAYFAIAVGTVQFGFDLGVRYKAGPLAFTGSIGGDALIHLDPFSFLVSVRVRVAVEFEGHDLLGLTLEGSLGGPDRWRIKGRIEIRILFFDVTKRIDEAWGDEAEAFEHDMILVEALVAADLNDEGNWQSATAPEAGTLVAFGEQVSATAGLVHPVSTFTFRQRRIPYGIKLDHLGRAAIEGSREFPVPSASDAAGNALPVETLTDPFAVAEYVRRDDASNLTLPSFELLPSGIGLGSAGYKVDPALAVAADVDYEQLFLPTRRPFNVGALHEIDGRFLGHILAREAAGRSVLRASEKMARKREPVRMANPGWVRVDRATLAAEAPAAEAWINGSAAALAGRRGPTEAAGARTLVVEAYEVAA